MSTFVTYEVALELLGELRSIIEIVGKHDSNLADHVVDASRARGTLDRLLGLLWGLTHPGRKRAPR
jgi:hypothetical protein